MRRLDCHLAIAELASHEWLIASVWRMGECNPGSRVIPPTDHPSALADLLRAALIGNPGRAWAAR